MIHAFCDGFSSLDVYPFCASNNLAETALSVFSECKKYMDCRQELEVIEEGKILISELYASSTRLPGSIYSHRTYTALLSIIKG